MPLENSVQYAWEGELGSALRETTYENSPKMEVLGRLEQQKSGACNQEFC
jgi:hypothetical protein